MPSIEHRTCPVVSNDELNELFAASWPAHEPTDFERKHAHSLAFVCAFADGRLIGYVNLAWDGGIHAFVLDTTVHPAHRRRGVGRELVSGAAAVARERGMQWLHVDFEPHLAGFYRGCGFAPTEAGLMKLGG
ncbi:GNAT family N-acetyltransferase [Sorangium sp. So ce321]|uniref:GNAT family N-acetyltransferase n=1 Tax=Sorangium sp. So ce321 TaxID=3133300 RepID=UPI003F5E0E1B